MGWDADMKRKTKVRLWIATIVIGILMIPAGVGWIIYTVTQTGHYDSNAEFTDPDTHITSHGGYVSSSPLPFLGWIHQKALHCVPAPLGKQRSRDATDDPFLACALAAQAKYIVASDRDLLSLGKPFGIAILTPAELVRRLART